MLTKTRSCATCGGPRKGHYRAYCSMACYALARASGATMEERKLGRSRALRKYPSRPCDVCGVWSTGPGRAGLIHRHHRDGDQTNNAPGNITFLCKPHHDEEHARMRAAGIGRPVGGPRPRVVALMREQGRARYREAAELRAAGLSDQDIADRMGFHPASVARWFKKYDVALSEVTSARLPATDTEGVMP